MGANVCMQSKEVYSPNKHSIKSIIAAALVLLAPAAAQAGNDGAAGETSSKMTVASLDKGYEYTYGAAVVSDYVTRGFSETRGGPALQAEANLSVGAVHVGFWASTLDYGHRSNGGTRGSGTAASPDVEGDFYIGYEKKYNRLTLGGTTTYVAYIGAGQAGAQLDYVEFKAEGAYEAAKDLTLGGAIYFSPDYYDRSGKNWIFEANLKKELPKLSIFTPSLNGSISYQAGDEKAGGFDYWFYDAGVTLAFREHYKIDLKYHDTIDVPFDCQNQCGSRFVAAFKAEF
jgi:uncharacterized protein (TIGR02001 family)